MFPWFDRRGILGIGPWTGLIVYSLNFIHAALIYVYQVWLDGVYERKK